MSASGRRAVRAGAVQRRGSARMSPKALYARPMALRQLYADAGTLMRRGQREAAAAHQQNSR
ncbi:hypothetical protein [Saccharomonospora cyanea]|uniref:Uncharacterized protein n=1 Tax=Saccharomonospora cyanea NA-134 TaxID=882082 RepID=H5XGC7_9PSEU|nr:hypothetical protein [Saccharomonospora cyanea]EHR59446.1 hypothetical protein SaccyDRAFT_0518 [Saccharomonospora cyanea NA-134]